MNPEIEAALTRFDPVGGSLPDWQRIMLVRNYGAAALSRRSEGEGSRRGFDFVVLGRDGRPTRYCKLRGSEFQLLQHENEMIAMFRDSPLAEIVPEAAGGIHSSWTVQVARFIDGPLLLKRFSATRDPKDDDLVDRALELCHQLSDTASELSPQYRPQSLQLSMEGTEPLKYLCESAGDRERIAAIGARLEGISRVPSSPQHGDFWAANVILGASGWRILDLEYFGTVMVPLYDVFHFLRTYHEADGASIWVDLLVDDPAVGAWSRRRITRHAEMWSLTPDQALGIFLYYTLHMAATTHRDPGRDARAAIRQLDRVCDLIDRGQLEPGLIHDG